MVVAGARKKGRQRLGPGRPGHTVRPGDRLFQWRDSADPKSGLAYCFRGTLWQWKEKYDQAIADFTEAIRIDPRDAQAYVDRGDAWGWTKDLDRAIADYTEAIRIDPDDPQAYDTRGLAWSEQREYDKALADFKKAIRIDPQDAEAYNNCAWIWATCPDADHRTVSGPSNRPGTPALCPRKRTLTTSKRWPQPTPRPVILVLR